MREVNLESLDRTIFELIRLKLVEKNLLPDIASFPNLTDYENEKKAWSVDPTKTLVEVFGVGSSKARGRKEINRILIDRKASSIGTLGGDTTHYVENESPNVGEDFTRSTKKRRPESSFNINYEIRIILDSEKLDRILNDVLFSSLGTRRGVKLIEGTDFGTASALLVFMGEANVSSTDYIERLFMYTYPDVWLDSTSEVLATDVAPLLEITVKINDGINKTIT